MTASIDINNVSKHFGGLTVFEGLSLSIPAHEFVVFLGPSGCGKSTLLRMIAGLESVDDGEIRINGERIDDQPPGKRGVAMVFQSYALYPHMTVRDNMAFGLKNIAVERSVIDARIAEAARMLEIGHLLERKPGQLSGGQRQRVAIGRAVVKEPKAFLFDEPLSNLDAALRTRTRIELAQLHQRLKSTMIFVTHDQIEAMTLASRIVAMNAGYVQQIGAPLDLYDRPANLFVAGFIGSPGMNFLEGRCVQKPYGSAMSLPDGSQLPLGRRIPLKDGEAMTLGIRPEHVVVSPETGGVDAKVELVEPTGLGIILHLTVHGLPFKLFSSDRALLQPGASIRVGLPEARLHVFDSNGDRVNTDQ